MEFFIRYLYLGEIYQDIFTLSEFKKVYANPDISILYAERIVE